MHRGERCGHTGADHRTMERQPSPYQLRRMEEHKLSTIAAVVSVAATVLLILVTFRAAGY